MLYTSQSLRSTIINRIILLTCIRCERMNYPIGIIYTPITIYKSLLPVYMLHALVDMLSGHAH